MSSRATLNLQLLFIALCFEETAVITRSSRIEDFYVKEMPLLKIFAKISCNNIQLYLILFINCVTMTTLVASLALLLLNKVMIKQLW